MLPPSPVLGSVQSQIMLAFIDDIKHSMTCTTVLAQSVPVVDMVSSCTFVSTPNLGSKTSGHENPKGDSVKEPGSTREH